MVLGGGGSSFERGSPVNPPNPHPQELLPNLAILLEVAGVIFQVIIHPMDLFPSLVFSSEI